MFLKTKLAPGIRTNSPQISPLFSSETSKKRHTQCHPPSWPACDVMTEKAGGLFPFTGHCCSTLVDQELSTGALPSYIHGSLLTTETDSHGANCSVSNQGLVIPALMANHLSAGKTYGQKDMSNGPSFNRHESGQHLFGSFWGMCSDQRHTRRPTP